MTNKTLNDDFIIKPLSTDFDIRMMRQLIAQWRVAGLTDSQIVKMQLLYFGEPAWMNLDKMYDCTRFIHIVKGMRFRTTTDFLEVLLKCKGFGCIWKNDQAEHTANNLLAFYSPLWHELKEEDTKEGCEHSGEEAALQKSDRYIPTNDIFNKKKNIQKKNISYINGRYDAMDGRSNAAAGCQPLNARAAAERERIVDLAARELLSNIALNDDAYTLIVKPIQEKTQQLLPQLYNEPEESHPTNMATRCFFFSYVYPYLTQHGEKMMKIPTLEGRCSWLRNLIQLDFMQKNIQRAVNDTHQYLRLHAEEMRRQNRPISPHEYQDQASGQRFYDYTDPKDGSLKTEAIPQDAEERPSATARWNKFAHAWKD